MTCVPSIRWNLFGMFTRFWAHVGFLSYQYTFFGFYNQPALYSYSSLVIMLVGGSISNIAAAGIAEKWGKSDPAGKGYVPAIMAALGLVFSALMYQNYGLYASLGLYAAYFTLTDGFVAPVLSMLAIAAPTQAKGQVMGYFVTVISLSNLIMPIVVSNMIQSKGTPVTMETVSFVLIINCCVSNGLAMISFFFGGRAFKNEMIQQEKDKAAALAQAIVKVPEIGKQRETLLRNSPKLSNKIMNQVVDGVSVRETVQRLNYNDDLFTPNKMV